ncbi:uncharacterized protein [Lepeophtheirus salmonis]|uniref:uncharacterized protein isoform X1 n=1 Tax=Lepeophtheirus salmonis TaxID=72036 RepID=UPI001AE2563D|nr:uncharacterized protein LOC121124693 isoform X1 [Lepeophtheirus salmonis]
MIERITLILTSFFLYTTFAISGDFPRDRNEISSMSVMFNCVDESNGDLEVVNSCMNCFFSGSNNESVTSLMDCVEVYFQKGSSCTDNLPSDITPSFIYNISLCLDQGLYNRLVYDCLSRINFDESQENPQLDRIRKVFNCIGERFSYFESTSVGFRWVDDADFGSGSMDEDKDNEPAFVNEFYSNYNPAYFQGLSEGSYEDVRDAFRFFETEIHCNISDINVQGCLRCFSSIFNDENKMMNDKITSIMNVYRCSSQYLRQEYVRCFERNTIRSILSVKGATEKEIELIGCFRSILDGVLAAQCIDGGQVNLENQKDLIKSFYEVNECVLNKYKSLVNKNFPYILQTSMKDFLDFISFTTKRPRLDFIYG